MSWRQPPYARIKLVTSHKNSSISTFETYKSSWVRTTRINPWGINLGFATILLCIYNELLPPHPPTAEAVILLKGKSLREPCVHLMSLWEGRRGFMDQKAIAFLPPPRSSGIPLKRPDRSLN